jgi:hypothetical protein
MDNTRNRLKMLKTYREISLTTKIVAFLLTVAVFFSIGFQIWQPMVALTVTAIIASIFITAHIIITYPRFTKTAIISVIQILALTFISSTYGVIYVTDEPISVSLTFLTAIVVLIVVSIINIYLNYNYGKGNKTLHILLSLTLLNMSGLVIAVLTPAPLLLTLFISSIIAILYTLWRSKLYSPKKEKQTRKELYVNNLETILIKIAAKYSLELTKTDNENFWVITEGNKKYLIAGLNLTENIIKTDKGQNYKNVPFENIIGELTETANIISHKHKLNKKTTQFIILDINNKYGLSQQGYAYFAVTSKNEKTNTIGRLMLANKFGLTSTLNQHSLV